MSDSCDQVTKTKQKVNDVQSAGCGNTNICAQRLLYETQSIDSKESPQTTQEIIDIKIETNNDQGTSNSNQNVPVRVNNKAAEHSRLYRERHREEINQRRRDTRRSKKKSHQIQTPNIQINEMEQILVTQTTSNKQRSSSHTRRQRRYYEKHKEEINERKRDNRLKQNILQSIPATAAERNRNYRARNKQKINERRRDSRRQQRNVNNIDATEITNTTPNEQQNLKSSIGNFLYGNIEQAHTQHVEETHSVRVQTIAALQTTEDNVKKPTEEFTKHQTHLIRTDYKCNECTGDIVGCRYVCVQCTECDVCAACEARGKHKHHYALRVPPHKHTHEVMVILERIRHIINTEMQEVPVDETESIKCEVDTASDPLEAMVKVEMLDIDEYEPVAQTVHETTIKQEAQGGEGNKRQQRRKRRAPSPDTRTDTPPVTLPDAHTGISHTQPSLITSTKSKTRNIIKTRNSQVSVPTWRTTMNEQTSPSYEMPMTTPANINAPVTFNQATGSVIPIIMYNIPKTEISDELQSDQVLTSATSSSQAQVVSFDTSQPVEEIVIKTELPD